VLQRTGDNPKILYDVYRGTRVAAFSLLSRLEGLTAVTTGTGRGCSLMGQGRVKVGLVKSHGGVL